MSEVESCIGRCADTLGSSDECEDFYNQIIDLAAARANCLRGDCYCPDGVCAAHNCVRPGVCK